jgi:hypothetical protein
VSFVPVDKNNIFDQGQGDDENNVDDDDDVFYDSVQDVEVVKKKQQKEEPEIISRTSSMHDLNETANPISMTDSFVRLPYASNTNDGDPYSNEAQDDKMAIKDPSAAEGGLQRHPTLKLLKTNEPMQIPVTQVNKKGTHFLM